MAMVSGCRNSKCCRGLLLLRVEQASQRKLLLFRNSCQGPSRTALWVGGCFLALWSQKLVNFTAETSLEALLRWLALLFPSSLRCLASKATPPWDQWSGSNELDNVWHSISSTAWSQELKLANGLQRPVMPSGT